MTHEDYLSVTPMLDFDRPLIQSLIQRRGWAKLSHYDAIGEIYTFVRDEVLFGYSADDRLPASEVLYDGYGQCNTKGTLLIALLRAVGVPTRIHGFTIYNALQRGAIPDYLFFLAPERILHSWVEVLLDDRWVILEGYIIDRPYLNKVQTKFACSQFSGYGVATSDLDNPSIDWIGEDTYIQSEGIADDFGVYERPDDFYQEHGSNLSGIKKWVFRYLLRHLMNLNVNRIRARGIS